ncbi:MAG TPA: hypothetical protein VFS08_20915 [Gemmatimonadaceae bacterium]|nr:hypothetical protein [Gemmatimonadaceae bacterium]
MRVAEPTPRDDALPVGAGSRATALAARAGRPVLLTGLLGVWGYLWAVLLYDERVAGVYLGFLRGVAVLAVGAVLLVLGVRALARRRRLAPTRMLDLGIAALALLASVVAADVAYGVYDNARRARAAAPIADDARLTDGHLWHGELFPRLYFPTDLSFGLYKPDVRLTGPTYGEFYTSAMQRSPTLVDSVLQPRTLTYAIGPHGVRELEPLAGSRIFALGDSFVLGYATDEGETWTDRLGAALGEPVYNLGVSSTGPRAQLQLLEYLLATNADSMHVERLLWMIFEGNDLENDYDERREPAAAPGGGRGALLDNTLPQLVLALPARVKGESILRRLLDGELRLGRPHVAGCRDGGRYEIDGVALPVPLYHSRRWGYRFFNPDDAERAAQPRSYVLEHPHRPLLDRTLRDMRALSERHGFQVMVILAPSDARLYGADFDGFPTPSPEPYFAEYVAERSRELGFQVVDLVAGLRPYAARELLYYRDDHHWNARGNAIAAQLIEAALRDAARAPALRTAASPRP